MGCEEAGGVHNVLPSLTLAGPKYHCGPFYRVHSTTEYLLFRVVITHTSFVSRIRNQHEIHYELHIHTM